MADIKPTRSELIKLKKRIALAKGGHKLLEKKRDGLVQEFFEILKDTKRARGELLESYKIADEKLKVARALHSDPELEGISMAVQPAPDISLKQKNIMGTIVPSITSESMKRPLEERGYGILTVSNTINEACAAYEELLNKIILVAEVETTTRRLIEEIGKTKRRVNVLEYEIIPDMETTRNNIMLRLEEIERETIFRTKMVKRKLEERNN